MTRYASTTNQAEGDKSSIRLFIAVDLDFPSGHVRAHDGVGTINWGGNDYLGVGRFGGIEVAEETIDVVAKPLVLTLSGVDPALVATATGEKYQGRTGTVYLGFIDSVSNVLMDTPEMLWEGRMDQMVVSLSEATGSIRLSCEHRLRREPRIARYTDADQKIAYPTDRFFDLIGKINGFKGTWGAKGVVNSGESLYASAYQGYNGYGW